MSRDASDADLRQGLSSERKTDACLNLAVNGVCVTPFSIEHDRYRFLVRDASDPIRIRSLTASPSMIFDTTDSRRLGVAVSAIVLRSGDLVISVGSGSGLLSEGYHAAESHYRWTDGNAAIPGSLLAPIGSQAVEIEIQVVQGMMPYPTLEAVEVGGIALKVDGPVRGPHLLAVDDHFEGVAYSADGSILGVAAAGTDAILLYRRCADGCFDPSPFRRFGGRGSMFTFFHDLVFATAKGRDFLLAIERRGRVSIWALDYSDRGIADAFVGQMIVDQVAMSGASARREPFTDALAIVPGHDRTYLAIADHAQSTILFYDVDLEDPASARLVSRFANRFVRGPDGLAFSGCGRWLAVANHGNHDVVVFSRAPAEAEAGPSYDPEPIAILGDATLMHPHSVAFCPVTHHLIVSNAAGRCVCIFAFVGDQGRPRWSTRPATTFEFTPGEVYKAIQSNGFTMEGGAKGVAIHDDEIAICSPEMGVLFYTLHNEADPAGVRVRDRAGPARDLD